MLFRPSFRNHFSLLLPLVCLSSCQEPSIPVASEGLERRSNIREEFENIAERLEQSANPYFGTKRLVALEAQLATSENQRNASLWLEQCFHQLRLGRLEDARRSIDTASEIAALLQNPQLEMAVLKVRTMVSLREAETANCIQNHNRECCIFPLEAGGLHQQEEPMRRAKADLLAALQRSPEDQMLQWLLNIACMALDEYPDGIPEKYRIPQSYFEPEISTSIGAFTDVAPGLGLATLGLAGGVIVEDFDANGFLDIVTSTSDPTKCVRLFLNAGDGTFQASTMGSGLDAQLGGLNCVGADYDGDGDTDIFVLRGAWLEDDGQIRNSLLRNNGVDDSGKLTFADVTEEAGLAELAMPTQTASWGDFDNDGDLDLYVGNESRKEITGSGDYPAQLFLNDGTNHFTDVAQKAGVQNDRFCKGTAVGDFDNDGDLDLYVSNVGLNRLYRNDGTLKFTDVAEEAGVQGFSGYNFAPWFFDFNNDGWLDLFVGSYKAGLADFMADARGHPHQAVAPHLFVNNRDGTFTDMAADAGLAHPFLPMGANFGDVDNDGFLDIYLATGESRFEVLTPNILLRNVDGKRFENATYAARLGHLQKGHGVAFADFDHDGDQDIFNQLGGFFPGDQFQDALFLNPGNANHRLTVKCVGTISNRQAIGARLTVAVIDQNGQRREIHRAAGAVSSFGGSPSRQEIGLGKVAKILSVSVVWPASGTTQVFDQVPLNSGVIVTEGEDVLQSLPLPVFRFKE